MYDACRVAVVIPALNEEQALPRVLASLPAWVDAVAVVDNGSTDGTAAAAERGGARVVHEEQRGYGAACLAGIAAADEADIVALLDGDLSDHPKQTGRLVAPIAQGEADLVIGSRVLGARERGSLTVVQRWGNALACYLIRRLWGHRYTDLGPFRAVRASALHALRMDDRTYGWTIQMQIRAVRAGLRVREVPVDYRRRIGRSKISGTVRGVLGAGTRILATVARERWRGPALPSATVRAEHLIVLSRAPEPGAVKTRLIPTLGAEGAADLQREMIEHTLLTAEQVRFARGVSGEVRWTGGAAARRAELAGLGWFALPQGDGDLGARMHRAMADSFSRGARSVIVIGTDCPSLVGDGLGAALDALRAHDCVIGPAHDGGYYLIGLRRPAGHLFEGLDWGTDQVLRHTLRRAAEAGMSIHLLAPRSDIDQPADLPEWRRCHRPRLSVVIPALKEAAHIGTTICSALDGGGAEVLVVDGGSTDDTCRQSLLAGARVVYAAAGRARQMNAGAVAARGSLLLFLHADTRLPRGYAQDVEQMFARADVVLGAFRLGIDHPGAVFRWIERGANIRSRRLGLPYGDQGLVVRAADFFRLGGFPELPIMEDYEFERRARRAGRVAIARSRVWTSARRWVRCGAWRLTLIHQVCVIAYRLGIAPERIARWRECGPTAAETPERAARAADRARRGECVAEVLAER